MGWLKTGIGKLIAGVAATTVAVVAVVLGVMFLGKDAYRTIAVEETNGISIVENQKDGSNTAYEGMHLYSGDDVKVQDDSDLTMLLDMDKYVYAEEKTHFWLEAEGDSEKSKTKIHLEDGSELSCLRTELTEGETYEVDTPNSVMAVRGTVFRVTVYYDSNGVAWTRLEVFQGGVYVELKTLEGEFNGVSEVFTAGEAALIRASNDFSEFVVGENGSVKHEIAYKEIPQKTAMQLISYMDMGEELCIGKELLMDYTKLQEHKTEEIIVEEPTCTQEGKKEIYCIVCEEVDETVTIPALGHKAQEDWVVVTEANCTTKGLEQKQCTICGEVVETQEINALGHQRQAPVVTKEVNCTEDGRQVAYCARCGKAIEETTLAALGHNYGVWTQTVAAGCTTTGSEVRICSICGETEYSTLAALGHNYGAWTEVLAAGCETEGSEERVCSRCQNAETQTLAALGHNYGAWTEVLAAGCETEGSEERVCSRCQNIETQAIAALGHNYVADDLMKEATCTTEGSQLYICSRCNDEIHQTIAALGHNFVAQHDYYEIEYQFKAADTPTDTITLTVTCICDREGCDLDGAVIEEEHTIRRSVDDTSGYTYYCETCNAEILKPQ